MFDKDEDYWKARKESKNELTKVIKVWSAREETLHDAGFEKGAEFAYNKANEWHKVADGDLPPLRKEVLWCVDKQLWLGELLESRIDFGEWELDSVLFNDYEITWKEIVFPEEVAK